MKIKPIVIIKILLIVILIIYVNLNSITESSNIFEAYLTLLVSVFLLFKGRKNLVLVVMFFFIFYSNYSIILGEYIIGGDLSSPFQEVKNIYYYGVSIRTILLFMVIITLFYDGKLVDYSKQKLIPKDNYIIFYSIIMFLVYILIFEVQRGNLQIYSVRITPLYEYSKILFLFAYYFSGKSIVRKIIFFIFSCLFILQDFYYGGRITSLQLLILLITVAYPEKLTFNKIIIFGFIGIFLNSLVGAYRGSFSFENINPIRLLNAIFHSYFVFDTPVFAYYASMTHIAASEIAKISIRVESFSTFILSVFTGSDDIKGNVSALVSRDYFFNLGGGIYPTHFYFWLGWGGVICSALILILIINRIGNANNDFEKLLYFAVVFIVPRWYLYSPITLFRGALLFVTILFLFFNIINKFTSSKRRSV